MTGTGTPLPVISFANAGASVSAIEKLFPPLLKRFRNRKLFQKKSPKVLTKWGVAVDCPPSQKT
jgi:hypothetical protein